MLLKFRIKNFKSFGNEQEFNTIPGRYNKNPDHVVDTKKYKALKFSAIFGGNASGKSNFVEALTFLRYVVVFGEIPRAPFDYKFRLADLGRESNLEIEVGLGEKILIYGISIDIFNRQIFREYLYLNSGRGDKAIFDRSQTEILETKLVSELAKRINIYFNDLQPDQFLLTRLAEAKDPNKSPMFPIVNEFRDWFRNNLQIITPQSTLYNKINQFIQSKEEGKEFSVIDILKTFDTGITNYVYQEMDIETFINKVKTNVGSSENFITKFYKEIEDIKAKEKIEMNIAGDFYRVEINEKTKKPFVQQLGFRHCGDDDKYFAYKEESDGTQRLIELVNILYNVQNINKTYIIDEIERSFHSNLTIEFIKKFLLLSQKNNSQLIISTHETNVMNLDFIRLDELWLIDRNRCGMSNLVSLSDYKLRSDKVLDKDYLLGRYGGVPKITSLINGARSKDEADTSF